MGHNALGKATTRNAAGDIVSTVYDTMERLAIAYQIGTDEIAWAIEEEGVCDIEGPWEGQTTTIEEWNA